MENINVDCEKLKHIDLEEVKVFFNKRAFWELLDLGINNVGNLLEKDISGELVKLFHRKHKEAYELWNNIHGTIIFLKYKYLNIDFSFDVNDKSDFVYKSGFSQSVRKRLRSYDSLSLNNLIKMVNTNDYSKLYEHFSFEGVEEIVNKVKVIRDYFNNKGIVSVDDLKELYNKLFFLVEKHKEIGDEIKLVQSKIDEMLGKDEERRK